MDFPIQIYYNKDGIVEYMFSGVTGRNFLTLYEPITTAAEDKFCDIFPNFRKIRYDIPQQTILMKYALFVIFEKAAKFEIFFCCKL